MTDGFRNIWRAALMSVCVLATGSLQAQSPRVGFKASYGHSDTRRENHKEIEPPFEEGDFNYIKLGFEYQHFLHPEFTVNSGLCFFSRFGDFADFNYLAIPLSLDLNLGRKFQFIFGPGIDLSYLVGYELKKPYGYSTFDGFDESKNRFQVGWQLHGGIGVALSPQTQLRLMYEHHVDWTKMYAQDQYSPGGAYYTDDRWWYDGFLSLTFLTGSHLQPKSGKGAGS